MDKTKGFTKPETAQLVPPDQKDAVDRIVAAGMKIMYSPEMRDDVVQAATSKDPTPQKLAKSIVGLLLILDDRAKKSGGIPVGAMLWAAVELLGEACEVLAAMGQKVTMDDYHTALQLITVMAAKKMGATDEQIMALEKQGVA